jgi:hypothetical protein
MTTMTPSPATAAATEAPCRRLANAFVEAPVMMTVGSGPSYGTALFTAPKII